MRQLELTTRIHDGHTVVALHGELDIATADDLRRYLRSARASSGQHLILDLTELEFMDSRGLSVIISCHKAVSASEGTLSLVAPRPIVRRTLEITGLHRRLPVHDTIEEASAPAVAAGT